MLIKGEQVSGQVRIGFPSPQKEKIMFEKITVYTAKKIITMTESMPAASAVAVADGKIVSVGTLESLKPWLDQYPHEIDETFADKIIMPSLIDPHVHPSLPAVLTQFPFLAPDDWVLPTGVFPGAKTPASYEKQLKELVAEHPDWEIPFISWGYHQLWHGNVRREQLDEWFPDHPVILWHRSFHELIVNSAAIEWLEITEKQFENNENANWSEGHFWETGAQVLLAISKMPTLLFAPDRYKNGMKNFYKMMQQAGITTVLDMGVGVFGDPFGEADLIRAVSDETGAPARIILTPIITDFLGRGISPEDALKTCEKWEAESTDRVIFDRHFKLMMDGAIYSGLSMYDFPGYVDGHAGQWMHPPETSQKYAEVFWKAGYQLHAHTNGDLSAAKLIEILRYLQDIKPRFDHRFVLEHYAYTNEDQLRQWQALGGAISTNPYYYYILSDIFSDEWLGADRGGQMVRLGALERKGIPFALHSDCPMAPLSPLTLAWVASNRVTINGKKHAPSEKISLETALRAITIDAAWIMRKEDEIGSIRAGKRADFAILEQDPYEVGAEGLKDIEIWGVVFEGEKYPVEK